jgi:glycosyltransferase involved in cell wall biosynthesis
MRIGFDARCLQTASARGGVGRYARSLLEHLPLPGDEMVVYLSAHRERPRLPSLPGSRVALLRRPSRGITLWDPIAWPPRLRKDGIEVFHSPFYGVPVRRPEGTAVVATVHDLIPLIFPDAVTRRQGLIFRRHFARALTADRIIVPSRQTKKDLVERLGADPRRISVIALGVDGIFTRPPGEIVEETRQVISGGRPYILHVGGLDPLKELPLLLSAFAQIASRWEELTLVVCGARRGAPAAGFAEAARKAGVGGRVALPGRMDDRQLAAVYAAAEMLVYPSRYEGFGLPPLEAMACGCPVVASSGGSLGEVLGEAAYLVPPRDLSALVVAIERVLGDEVLRHRLTTAGRSRAGELRWEETARRTREAYERALARARGTGMAPEEGAE